MKEPVEIPAAARVAFARVVFASKIMTNVREDARLAQLVVMLVRVLAHPIVVAEMALPVHQVQLVAQQLELVEIIPYVVPMVRSVQGINTIAVFQDLFAVV